MGKVPLRLRLTLIYGLVLGLALAVAAVLTASLVGQNLLRELDDKLLVRASALHRALNITDEGFDIGQITVRALQVPVNEFAVPGTYIQVIDERGHVVVASANLQDQPLPVDPSVIADGLAARPSLVTLSAGEGEHLRVLTTPMIHREHVVGLLQVAASLHTINATLNTLGLQLAFGVLASWLLALLLIWRVVGGALRSVVAISTIAEHIATTGDVGQRVAFGGASDELGELAATFNRMLERIQRGFAAHRQFVADSSHQLGTPLTVIRGNAELLDQAISPEDRGECIAAIMTEVERMDKVVGDLLTLAQLDARPPVENQAVRLDLLTQEVAGQARTMASERRIVVTAAESVMVWGDPARLSELLFNLLHNAVRYSADRTKITARVEPVRATVGLPSHQTSRWGARLVVSDEGVGIPAADVERIFDRFYRVNRTQPDGQRGTGLGLAIVKAIAEAHEATVTVRSELGRGSEFTVTFPREMMGDEGNSAVLKAAAGESSAPKGSSIGEHGSRPRSA